VVENPEKYTDSVKDIISPQWADLMEERFEALKIAKDRYVNEYLKSIERIEDLENALREIAKAEGPFNRDPHKHAENTIESMVRKAKEALESTTFVKKNVPVKLNLKGWHMRIMGAICRWDQQKNIGTDIRIFKSHEELDLAQYIESYLEKSGNSISMCYKCGSLTVDVPDTVDLRNDKPRCAVCMYVKEE